MVDKALSKEEVALLASSVNDKITSLRRAAAKATRPQFREVYDQEILFLRRLLDKLEETYGK